MSQSTELPAPASVSYAEFGRQIFEVVKECIREGCLQCDSETLADIAVKCGLMVYVKYDPEKHGTLAEEYEIDDMIYWWGGKSA